MADFTIPPYALPPRTCLPGSSIVSICSNLVVSCSIEQHGGLEAAHRLLKPDADFFSYGFEHLCQMRRDDLTMEAFILSLGYRDQIFSAREIAIANERLAAARQLYPPHSHQ